MTKNNNELTITVRLFSLVRDLCGFSEQAKTIRNGTTTGAVIEALIADVPELAPHAPSLLIAVNQEYAAPDHLLADGDILALFPPVSGG